MHARLFAILLTLVFSVLAASPVFAAKKDEEKKDAKPKSSAPVPKVAAANLGVISQTASQAGVKGCLARIDQVTGFLAGANQQGAMVFVDPKLPDQGLVSVSQEISSSQSLAYVGTAYTPGPDGYCGAVYESVTYWANTCDEVAKVAFPSFARGNALRQYVVVLDGGPSAKVFMMQAGRGCVTIKKEVVFQ